MRAFLTPERFLLMVIGIAVLILLAMVVSLRWHHDASVTSASPEQHGSLSERHDALKECMAWSEPADSYATSDADAESAYQECTNVTGSAAHDAAFLYQMGTTALFSGHLNEAQANLEAAAQAGSCAALYFLGRKRWHDDQAVEATESLYKRAADCGDKRAQKELFDPDDYKSSAYPTYMAALYNSDVKSLNRIRFLSASYVSGFYEAFSEQYNGETFNPCWSKTYYRGGDVSYGLKAAEKGDASNFVESYIYEKCLPVIYRMVLPAQGKEALTEVRETARLAGKGDAFRMIGSSHCGALLPYKVMRGIKDFAKEKKSLFATVRELQPQVHSIADLQALVSQNPDAVKLDP